MILTKKQLFLGLFFCAFFEQSCFGCCAEDPEGEENTPLIQKKLLGHRISPEQQAEYDRRHPPLNLESEDYPTFSELCFLCQIM